MFHPRHAVTFIAAVLLGMPGIGATADAMRGAAISPGFEGTISQIGAKTMVIDGVSFPYGWLADPDVAPVPLENFSPGDHVFFQVNKRKMLVTISPMPKAAEPGRQREPAPRPVAAKPGQASAPAKPTPIKKQNGVWTN